MSRHGESAPGTAASDEAAVQAELYRIGAHFDPAVLQETRALYRSHIEQLPWADRPIIEDIAYGQDERHRLDVYPADHAGAPVILFLHGGGFVGGDKRGDPTFYANVGRYFAAHGYLAVIANYRLAPAATWPSGIEDVAAIIDWIGGQAGDFGGDSNRTVLVGQSAGAAHVAGHLFGMRNGNRTFDARGAILMSGFYRATSTMVAGAKTYFGEDEAVWSDRSPAANVDPNHPPLLLSIAELDPAEIAEQTLDFAQALNAVDGRAPQLLWFEGHNHVSTVHGLGLGRDLVGTALRRFIDRVTS